MSNELMIGKSQKTSSVASWDLGVSLLADLNRASGMSARETCLQLVCPPTTGNCLLQTEANERPCVVRHSEQGRQS